MIRRNHFIVMLVSVGLLQSVSAIAQEKAKAKPTEAAAPADPHAADRAAIAEALKSLSKAFASRDPQIVAGHWTAEGEYENEAGVSLKGREALATAFSGFFAKTPELKSEVQPGGLRFLSKDTALSEGKVAVQRGPTVATTYARYSALLVREDGKWRLAKLTETPWDETSLDELAWLVGEWKTAAGENADIRTVYTWSSNRKFLQGQFTIKEKDKRLTLSGLQIIGIHPTTGQLHSWVFEADGGVGEGAWERDDGHWMIQAAGTLGDGTEFAETNVLRRVSNDVFTWQSVYRSLDDSEVADLLPVKISRVKSEK
jgi:uncharacterized protein (TIGR02246 family)